MTQTLHIKLCVGTSLLGLMMGGSVDSATKRLPVKGDSVSVQITPKSASKGTGILQRAPRPDVRQPRPLSAPIPHLGERADHCVTLTGIEAIEEVEIVTAAPSAPIKPDTVTPDAITPISFAEGVSGSLWSMGEWKPAP